MKQIFEEEWCCLQCGQCAWFKVDADRSVSTCKRIDHKHFKFAVPWFKSYDCGQFAGCPCRDFIPSDTVPWLKDHWKGWDDYWEGEKPTRKVWLTIDDNTAVRYAVSREDFINNTFLDANGDLKWIEKHYYKQSRKSPTGYILVKERNMDYDNT